MFERGNLTYVIYRKTDLHIIELIDTDPTLTNVENMLLLKLEEDSNYRGLTREDIVYNIFQPTLRDKLCDIKDYSYEIMINADKSTLVHFSKMVTRTNANLLYDSMLYKRDYTTEEISSIYSEHYINHNIRNAIKSGYYEAMFFPISQIHVNLGVTADSWKGFFNDPFLSTCADDKLKLANLIIRDGTYFPIIISKANPVDKNYYVVEGSHRIISLKLAEKNGLIDPNHKVLVIRMPYNRECFYTMKNEPELRPKLDTPLSFRYQIECEYGSYVNSSDEIRKCIHDSIISDGERVVNDFTGELLCDDVFDIYHHITTYPLFLRDLFSRHPEVKPSEVINNEKMFEEWLNSENA